MSFLFSKPKARQHVYMTRYGDTLIMSILLPGLSKETFSNTIYNLTSQNKDRQYLYNVLKSHAYIINNTNTYIAITKLQTKTRGRYWEGLKLAAQYMRGHVKELVKISREDRIYQYFADKLAGEYADLAALVEETEAINAANATLAGNEVAAAIEAAQIANSAAEAAIIAEAIGTLNTVIVVGGGAGIAILGTYLAVSAIQDIISKNGGNSPTPGSSQNTPSTSNGTGTGTSNGGGGNNSGYSNGNQNNTTPSNPDSNPGGNPTGAEKPDKEDKPNFVDAIFAITNSLLDLIGYGDDGPMDNPEGDSGIPSWLPGDPIVIPIGNSGGSINAPTNQLNGNNPITGDDGLGGGFVIPINGGGDPSAPTGGGTGNNPENPNKENTGPDLPTNIGGGDINGGPIPLDPEDWYRQLYEGTTLQCHTFNKKEANYELATMTAALMTTCNQLLKTENKSKLTKQHIIQHMMQILAKTMQRKFLTLKIMDLYRLAKIKNTSVYTFIQSTHIQNINTPSATNKNNSALTLYNPITKYIQENWVAYIITMILYYAIELLFKGVRRP
jgi:hypothetical protein